MTIEGRKLKLIEAIIHLDDEIVLQQIENILIQYEVNQNKIKASSDLAAAITEDKKGE